MRTTRGVSLPTHHTGSSLLHALLAGAGAAFPDVFGADSVPADPGRFKATYGDTLVQFEARRAASPRRAEVASAIATRAAEAMVFVDDHGERPLADAARAPAAPPPLTVIPTRGPGQTAPAVPFDGPALSGPALRAALDDRLAAHHLTAAAHRRLCRLPDAVSLRGHRFAVLGAGAELAPTRLLLAAGADVLWLDRAAPPAALTDGDDLGGQLFVPDRPVDLLAEPAAARAAIERFTDAGPAHLGLYAYAGGEGREWRLTAAMNALVSALGPERVASVATLISPTTAALATPEDAAEARRRRAAAGWVPRALGRVGALSRAGVDSGEGSRVGRVIVPLQGAAYQAAQYVGKQLFAEQIAVAGLGGRRITVSANVAPITATRSLTHPLFQAGFLGATLWGVWISTPATTQALNGWLMIGDLTDPEAPGHADHPSSGAERAAAVFSQQVHGGVFAQPWAFDGEIRLSALLGLARKPALLTAWARTR